MISIFNISYKKGVLLVTRKRELRDAKSNKKDEFYTQLTDIEKEMRYYRKHFKGKTVLCNCDDPFESNFFKYFVLNFNKLKLKKLIATCYCSSVVAGTKLKYTVHSNGQLSFSFTDEELETEPLESEKKPYKAIVNAVHDTSGDGGIDMLDVVELFRNGENQLVELNGDGDFRSDECIELLKESDIVVTNPPFSLFREYVAQLIQHEKKFIILGNRNAITYKDICPFLKNNKMWIGASIHSGDRAFYVPDDYPLKASGCGVDADGRKFIRVKGVRWYTNLDFSQRHDDLILVKKYSSEKYHVYDNYDAINVDRTADIPYDYDGVMGVPITFLDKYSPDQFEIIALGHLKDNFTPNKTYINPRKHRKDGTIVSGESVNSDLAYITHEQPVGQVYYSADNANGYLMVPYARILIRNRAPETLKGD